jgi:hypothetical protein
MAALRPQAIGRLGLIALVAMPIVRVVALLVGFAMGVTACRRADRGGPRNPARRRPLDPRGRRLARPG